MATSHRSKLLLPELAAIRTPFVDRIDRRLAVILGASLSVHVAIAAYAWLADVPSPLLGFSHVATTYQDVIDVTMPDDPLVPDHVAPPDAPGIATPAAPRQTSRPIVHPSLNPGVRPTRVRPPASGDDAQRLASILTGADPGARGTGTMSPRQPGADLGKQIDEARGRTITIGHGTQTSRSDDRARIGTEPHAPLVDNPRMTRTDRRSDEPVPGRISIGPVKQDDATTLTPALVLERIRTLYMAGLQRCYKDGLRLDATLGGRVAISFTVDDRGQVIDASAAGVSNGVDGCIQRLMTGWRFPIPKDKDGDATDAAFAVSLALQPS